MAATKKQQHGLLYEQVAGRVTQMIKKGTLKAGERIPSIRRMSEQMSVAISTVLHAYQLLEDRGLIEARPQAGYFVRPKHVRRVGEALPPPLPEMLSLPIRAGEARAEDVLLVAQETVTRKKTVHLGTAIPSPEFLPTEAIGNCLNRAIRLAPEQACGYEIGVGLLQLRRRVAQRAMAGGCSFGPDEIVITNGTTEALSLALQALTEPGDTVAVESPCYFGFLALLQMLRLKVVEVSTDPRDGISTGQLERLIRHKRVAVKALLLNPNVHNPLGSVMPDEKKRRIVELMEQAKTPIIEDDTYGDLAFSAVRPRCLKAFDTEDNVILCSSFSKTIAPGYRVGWVSAGRWHERVKELKCVATLGSATPPQMAVAAYLETGGFDRHLRRLRRVYAEQLKLLSDAVRRTFPEGTRATSPQGGHLLWVELPETVDTTLLHDQLAEHNITIAPGSVFSAGGHYRNFLRLNAAVSWGPRVERAVALIGELAEQTRI